MPKGFYIEITNNLLDPKHRKKMGTAVWEFMWCLDKITKIDENQIGWVYGGKPIQLKEISEELGILQHNVSKNLNKLKKEGYLLLIRTPRGLIIKINKAKKRFGGKVVDNYGKTKKRFTDKGERFTDKSKSIYRQDNDNTNNNIIINNLKRLNEIKKPLIEKMKIMT